ncbi:hypothetical protein FQZ97_1119960 [compost metagenome]
MFAPNPVETLFRHAKGDDDIDMITVVLLRRVLQRGRDAVALARFVIDEVSDLQYSARRCFDELEACHWVGSLPLP